MVLDRLVRIEVLGSHGLKEETELVSVLKPYLKIKFQVDEEAAPCFYESDYFIAGTDSACKEIHSLHDFFIEEI